MHDAPSMTAQATVIALALACAACTTLKKPPGAKCTLDSECQSEHCVATRDCGSKCTCEQDVDCELGGQCVSSASCGDSCSSLADPLP